VQGWLEPSRSPQSGVRLPISTCARSCAANASKATARG
jgi:hypothetical protein